MNRRCKLCKQDRNIFLDGMCYYCEQIFHKEMFLIVEQSLKNKGIIK